MTEGRWVVLGDDGRHISLGRSSEPTEAELATVADALAGQGLGGWLALMEGDYFSHRGTVKLRRIRRLSKPSKGWNASVAAFLEIRRQLVESGSQ